jgi:murein L,D-transpeptidase YcbB/YkuD
VTTFRSKALRSGLSLGLLALLLLPMAGCKGGRKSLMAHFHRRKAKSAPNTTDYADNVSNVISSPKLAILHWSNFTDFQPEVQTFYDDRNYELAWTRDGRPTAATTSLIQIFTDAAQKGLNPEDYDASRWPARVQRIEDIQRRNDTSDNAQTLVAEFDAAVTITAMRYASDVHLGRVNPQALNFDIDVPKRRAAFDVSTLLNDQVVDADDVPHILSMLEPQNPIYIATEQALPRYLTLAKQQAMSPPQPLPQVSSVGVNIGGYYPALEPLLQRLELEGDASSTVTPLGYDEYLSAAVKHFQQRHGITVDGKLTPSTIDALNVPMSRRVQQMDDSLERWRWLPDNYINPRILVNLPEFQLRAYTPENALDFKMRVVDGEAKGNHDTPMFVRLMRYVVFRPFWNLPPSIVKKEIVHHVEASRSYLADHDYVVTKNDGTPITNYTAADLEHSRFQVRQLPGPKNSLGLVKFLFPNEYDVYMHSTPELNLFNLTRRDRSHGCVRLQHADKMAQWVLSNDNPDGDWDEDKVSSAMNGDDNNRFVTLKTPLPVVITYLTAIVDEDGNVDFFNDIYGYDEQLEAALAKGRPYEKDEVAINPKLTPGETE